MAQVSESDTPEKFLKSWDDFEEITWKNINSLIKYISLQLFEDVIKDTPYRTGRALSNWHFSAGKSPEYKTQVAKRLSKKDREAGLSGYDTKDGANTIKKVQNGLRRAPAMTKKKVFEVEYYLTNNVPYIRRLEYGDYPGTGSNITSDGHSIQAPNGMARKNVQKWANMNLTHISKNRVKI